MARFAPIIIGLAVIAILYGALVAMVQPDMKKLIAYSSVSHMGFVMLGRLRLQRPGLQGAIFQMVSHGVTTGALFLLVGIIYEQTTTARSRTWAGSTRGCRTTPRSSASSRSPPSACPGLSGFIGEFLVLLGAFQYSGWVGGVAMVVVILSAVYMLWMFQRAFFTVPSDWMRRFWPASPT